MKNIILLLLLSVFVTAAFAQPPSDDRALQRDLRNLTRRADALKKLEGKEPNGRSRMVLKRAVEELAKFKSKHPGHNISSTEKFINDFKAKHNGASDKQTNLKNRIKSLDDTLDEVMSFSLDSLGYIDSDEAVTNAATKFASFKEKVNKALTPEVIAAAKEIDDRNIKRVKKNAERRALTRSNRFHKMHKESVGKVTDKFAAVRFYYEMATAREMLKVLDRVFPENEIIIPAVKKVDDYAATIGSLDSLQTKAGKNAVAKLAAVRMRKANRATPATLAKFRGAFNQRHAAKYKAMRVILVSNGWQIKRNKLTGIIIQRYRFGEVGAKGRDGKCKTFLIAMQQDHNGSGYGRIYYGMSSVRDILCENVKK